MELYENVIVSHKQTKNTDANYKPTKVYDSVKDEFEAIAGIVDLSGTWEEV